MTKFEFDLIDVNIVSNNKMYMPRPTKGGRSAYITKTNELRKFEDTIDELLLRLIPDEVVKSFNNDVEDDQVILQVSFDFQMTETDFFIDDASNYIKVLEDAIKYRLNIDDTRNCKLEITKHISSEDHWITHVIIETCESPQQLPTGKWVTHVKD